MLAAGEGKGVPGGTWSPLAGTGGNAQTPSAFKGPTIMRRRAFLLLPALGLLIGLAMPGTSQGQETSGFLAVGEMAPDIQVTGATRYGVLSEPVHLSDFRGETVVLAFFFRARSGG
jgi:hypothetical protein